MNTSNDYSASDIELIRYITLRIVQDHVPEETDLVSTVIEQNFQRTKQDQPIERNGDQIFSFSGSADLQSLFSLSLVWILSLIVIPFLRKAYEKAIEKTAEKTVESVASKLHDLLEKLRKDEKNQELLQQVDLLIPIDWKELNRQIIEAGKHQGLSPSGVKEIANLTVQELSNDRILVGNYLINVKRVEITVKKEK